MFGLSNCPPPAAHAPTDNPHGNGSFSEAAPASPQAEGQHRGRESACADRERPGFGSVVDPDRIVRKVMDSIEEAWL